MRAKKLMKKAIMAAGLLFPLAAYAQWSSNPLQNLGVGVAANDQVTPKMAATSDSGCYISWFDNRSGGYCMYLQRLNSAGVPQWAQNGLLISGHPQMTWLVDYDMTVDQNDNAVVVFSDIRSGGTNDLDVFAYKISPAGAFLWGADGIGLSATVNTDFEPAAKVTATNAGNFVFAWMKSGTTDILCFQKLSSGGQKLWGENGFTITPAASHSLSAPDLAPAFTDNAIALWKDSTGPPWSPTTWLYTQQFDINGNSLWAPGGVPIYNQGHISAWTYPEIITDTYGGAYYTWYDSPSLSQFNVSVQHVDATGEMIFSQNGVLASTNSNDRLHMNPALVHVPDGNALYVFWLETNFSQTQYGVYGQRFSNAGVRLWTDSGREFVGLGSSQISFVRAGAAANSLYIGYFEAPGVLNTAVKAFRIDAGGNPFWGPTLLSSETLGTKDDLLLVVNSENRAFLTWGDGRSDFSDIYAQNVNPDGSLGNPTGAAVSITLSPVNPPVNIPATGGSFDWNITLHNNETTPQTFDIWTIISGPVTRPGWGPYLNLTMQPGATINRARTQYISDRYPPGEYTYTGNVGDHPNVIWDSDSFPFTKLLGGDDSWANGQASAGLAPIEYALHGATPNPFNPITTLSFALPQAGLVRLTIFDASGREVAELVNGWREAGNHEVTFDATGLASGLYVYQLTASDFHAIGKMALMK